MDGATIWLLLLAIIAVAVVAVIFLRRRASKGDVPVDINRDYVDYTSLPPEEEPKTLGEQLTKITERFANLPLPGRIAVFASPVLVIGLLAIAVLVLQSPPDSRRATPPSPPPPPPPKLTIETARLVSPSSVFVEARTENIPQGSMATVELLAGGELFDWYDPVGATMPVSGSTVQFRLSRLPNAPLPPRDLNYTVRLRVKVGEEELERTADLEIPSVPQIRNGFFEGGVASQPEATNTPNPAVSPVLPRETPTEPTSEETSEPAAPEEMPTSEPTATPPETEATPTVASPPEASEAMMANVAHGGNVRAVPSGEPILTQVAANERVLLVEKQEGGVWYHIRTAQGIEGWIHYSLLDAVDLARLGPSVPVAKEIRPLTGIPNQPTTEPTATAVPPETPQPTGPTATVGNGGNVRAVPGGEPILDQIHAFETVELLKKLPDGSWYRIRNIRGVVGWVHYTLLNPDDLAKVSSQVPIEE